MTSDIHLSRRKLLAVSVVLGASAGCVSQDTTMTEQEARREFSAVVPFAVPEAMGHNRAVEGARFVDEEAGVVIYGFTYEKGYRGGMSVSALPLDQTQLIEGDEQ